MLPRARGLGLLDSVALGVLGLWCVWVVAATVLAGRPVSHTLPYLVPPLFMVAGVALGRWAAAHEHARWVGIALLGVGLVFVLGWLITPAPGKLPTRYPNANAAVAVQLIALSCLAWLAQRRRPASEAPRWLAPAALVVALAVIAVNASTAGTAVAAVVLLLCLSAVALRTGPWRWLTVLTGGAALSAAAYAQVTLARQSEWPPMALAALNRVRKQLWSEALGLWARNPISGGGAGSFRETNALSVDPDLAAAHSSVLQVGSEFGFVGLALFGAVMVLGLVLATRRDRATSLIAATAWVGLGVHSTMDHLYEFAAVTVAAAAVLGWASASQNSSTSPNVSRHADAGGGEAASGRDVSSGPAPGTGNGTSPAEGPVRRPMA